MAETNDIPKEITYGILKPLQKPGKAKGPPSNLRPIILLSSLRKILAACIIHEKNERKDRLRNTTFASSLQRSTTEHVFACKLTIERTISARNETVHLILLDMSKAFDSVDRKILVNDLRNTMG